MKTTKQIFIAVLFLVTAITQAQEKSKDLWSSGRPDGHAPISVMGDHMHHKGEWMFSYRYMYMNMEDLKRGTDDVGFDNALADYMVTPTRMPMAMHMLGAMYAPGNRITLMVMANYITSEMDHTTRMAPQNLSVFTTEISGFGDTRIAALYRIYEGNRSQVHAQFGISLPTGSVEKMDVTPASSPNEVILPYPMQTGSGTYDLEPAITWLDQWDMFSSGMQIRGSIRLGENDYDYRLGHQVSIQKWLAARVTPWLSFSGRLEWGAQGRIHGANPELNPMMVITADTANSGKTYANAGLGMNLYAFRGAFKNLRMGAEYIIPVYQNLYGVQLKQRSALTLGLQYLL